MKTIINDQIIKYKCQTFTPDDIVKLMLKEAKYKGNVLGKYVLENSCGDGQILVPLVRQYIKYARKSGLSPKHIKKDLETYFIAYEIDKQLIHKCKDRLNDLVDEYKIPRPIWNIYNADFLKTTIDICFDFVIGNPPYIALPDLPLKERSFLKGKYETCSVGKFDYCYAFIEKSYQLLASNGVLVNIIPNSIFKKRFAKRLRDLLISDLSKIIDFPQRDVFPGALVSPAIIVVRKNSSKKTLKYTNSDSIMQQGVTIPKDSLKDKWLFHPNICLRTNRKIGDLYKVSSALATLCNHVFILRNGTMNEDYYEVDGYSIEKSILRRTTSPRSMKYRIDNEYIIFPYHYSESGEVIRFSEDELSVLFPNAMKYLLDHKKELLNRKLDKNANWYEFGRSQALKHVNQRMLLISSIISDSTEFYVLEDMVPYSGLYIVPSGNAALEDLMPILSSDAFRQHVLDNGVCLSGNSKRVSPKDIENFEY